MNSKTIVILFSVLTVIILTVFLALKNPWSRAVVKDNYLILVGRDNPDSWDPLDFDKSKNIVLARLCYLTPIEADSKGDLSSTLLKSFSVSDDRKSIRFVLNDGLKFEDGSDITVNDLEISILRMALARPDFPVIRDIVGIRKWTREKVPLKSSPDGISVIGNEIKISFASVQRNPLFRFTLELFSIIPSKCIDKATSRLKCVRPPESGYYRFANDFLSENGSRRLKFEIRNKQTRTQLPAALSIVYNKNPDETEKLLKSDNRVVVATSGLLLTPDSNLLKIKNVSIQKTARSWFAILKIDKNSLLFKNKKDRNIFINRFMRNLREIGAKSFFVAERSIFTEIMPGYLKTEISAEAGKISSNGKNLKFSNSAIEDQNFLTAFRDTCAELGLKCIQTTTDSEHSDVSFLRTGFWAMDPIGDLKMLFTPKLHESLRDQWEDQTLLNLINDTYGSSNPTKLSLTARAVNEYLMEISLFNPVAHFQFIYLFNWSPEKPIVSQAISLPYPWHLFD